MIRHIRPVQWARTDVPRSSLESEVRALPSLTTVYRITQAESVARIERLLAAGQPLPSPSEPPVTADGSAPFAGLQRNISYARSLATAGQHLDHGSR